MLCESDTDRIYFRDQLANITYIVPLKFGVEDFFIGLLKKFISSVNYLPESEIIVVSESEELRDFRDGAIRVVNVPKGLQMWEKIAHLDGNSISTDMTAFITGDDFWLYHDHDLNEFKRKGSLVGSGNHAMAYPYKNKSFFLWQGWIQNSYYMPEEPSLHRFQEYISEGPVCHHAVYRTDYYICVLDLIKKLINVLQGVPSGVSVIEDCLNLTALCCPNHYLSNSWCLRFLDSNYGELKGWKSSLEVIKTLEKEKYIEVIDLIKAHLVEVNACISEKCLLLTREQIDAGLKMHVIGYLSMQSRKWRSGVDILFHPFIEENVSKLSLMPGTINKYSPTFIASPNSLDTCKFPPGTLFGSRYGRDIIKKCPEQVWELHVFKETGSGG